MKLCDASGTPILNAVSPFSAKQKSKSDVTGMEAVPICSCCLARSEPPTKPMATFLRRFWRRRSISGETVWKIMLVYGCAVERRSLGTYAAGWCEGTIDVEEADGILDGAISERRIVYCKCHVDM